MGTGGGCELGSRNKPGVGFFSPPPVRTLSQLEIHPLAWAGGERLGQLAWRGARRPGFPGSSRAESGVRPSKGKWSPRGAGGPEPSPHPCPGERSRPLAAGSTPSAPRDPGGGDVLGSGGRHHPFTPQLPGAAQPYLAAALSPALGPPCDRLSVPGAPEDERGVLGRDRLSAG